MRSISASTCAISCSALGESVVLASCARALAVLAKVAAAIESSKRGAFMLLTPGTVTAPRSADAVAKRRKAVVPDRGLKHHAASNGNPAMSSSEHEISSETSYNQQQQHRESSSNAVDG